MEPQKHNSHTSTADSDQQPEKPSSSAAASVSGGGRSYECTFCKRGFTNAQALGGHMNIHRKEKDKAKTKKKTLRDLSYFPQISPTDCNPGESNYRLYFPTSNYGVQTGNYHYSGCFPVWRHDHLEDLTEGNLSLGIGLCPSVGEDEDQDEVDLELRLGQYPC